MIIKDISVFDDSNGPIMHFSWAKFIINNVEHSKIDDEGIGLGKDIKIIKNEVKKWKERKGHKLLPKMLGDIEKNNTSILIIGNGVYGALKVPQKTVDYLLSQGFESVLVEKTPLACQTFNKIVNQLIKVDSFTLYNC